MQDLFTTEELETLLNRPERYNNLAQRNRVLISLLIYQALQPGEMETLTVQDINLDAGSIYIKPTASTNKRELHLPNHHPFPNLQPKSPTAMKCVFNRIPSFKTIWLLAAFIVIISSCKKNDINDPNLPPDQSTPAPSPSPVPTTVTVYLRAPGYEKTANVYFNGTTPVNYEKGGYTRKQNFDRYKNYIVLDHPTQWDYRSGARIVPATDAIRNYVDISCGDDAGTGSVTSARGSGYFDLPKGGKLIYPEYAFGHHFLNMTVYLFANVDDPVKPDFITSHLTTTVDHNNMRWYLQPFGDMSFGFSEPLEAGTKLHIEYPIPAIYQANAPDSIEAFRMNGAINWTKAGVAYKQGNMYKGSLDGSGSMVFGVRKQGHYKTIEVRTANDIPVINAIVNVKTDTMNIATARTDANGNALFFLPTNQSFTATVLSTWDPLDNPNPLTVNIGPFNYSQNSPVKIKYPDNPPQLRIVKGKALKCDGTPLQKGVVTVLDKGRTREYCHMPVVNGQYSGAMVKDRFLLNDVFILSIKDDATNIGNDTGIVWQAGPEKTADLYACKPPSDLYMNYTVDGVSYSVTNPGTQPMSSPMLHYSQSFSNTLLIAGSGIQLFYGVSYPWPGTNFIHVSSMWVNGVSYLNGSGNMTITRYDLIIGGYVEGSFDLKYRDNANVEHQVKGNFRVYRVS